MRRGPWTSRKLVPCSLPAKRHTQNNGAQEIMTASRMDRMFVVPLLLLATISACERDPKPVSDTAATPTPVRQRGQVFIVTRGGESIKLGLVAVLAYPESVITEHFRRCDSANVAALSDARESASESRDRIRGLRAQAAAADAELARLPFPSALPRDSVLISTRARLTRTWQGALRSAEKLEAESAATLGAIRALESPAFYFQELPPPSARSKSDADGRFEIALPVVPAVLVAQARRELATGLESYYWAVRVAPTRSDSLLFLSNDNLAGTGCAESIFDLVHHSGP